MRFVPVVFLVAFCFASPIFAQQNGQPFDRKKIELLAQKAYQSGDFQKANALVDQLLENGVKHPVVWHFKGKTLIDLGKNAEALTYLNKAVEADPEFISGLEDRMNLFYFRLRDPEKALADCQRLFELGEKHHFMRARICEPLGLTDQLIRDYSTVIEDGLKKDVDKRDDNEIARSYYYRGAAFTRINAWDLAIQDAKSSEAIAPNAPAKRLLGVSFKELKEFEQAIEQFDKLADSELSSLLNRAECYAGLGQLDKAAADIKKAKDLFGDQSNITEDAQSCADEVKRIAESGSQEQAPPPINEALRKELSTAIEAKNYKKAEELAIDLGRSGDPIGLYLSGKQFAKSKRADAALAVFSRSLNKTKFKTAEVTFLRAEQLFDLKAYDHAKTEYERAVQLGHVGINTRSTLGILHMSADEIEKAIEDYTYEITVDPPNANPASWLQLGIAYSHLGDLEQARKHFETLVEKAPPETQLKIIADNGIISVNKQLQLLSHLVGAAESSEETILQHFSPDYVPVLDAKRMKQSMNLIASKVNFNKLDWMDKETSQITSANSKTVFQLASGDTFTVYADSDGKLIGLSVSENGATWDTFGSARMPKNAMQLHETFWPTLLRGNVDKIYEAVPDFTAMIPREQFAATFSPIIDSNNSPLKKSAIEAVRILPDESYPKIQTFLLLETESSLVTTATMSFELYEGEFQ